jgi:hypothetical protein
LNYKYYSECDVLDIGCNLFEGQKVSESPVNGFFSDGIWLYEVSNSAIVAKNEYQISLFIFYVAGIFTATLNSTIPENIVISSKNLEIQGYLYDDFKSSSAEKDNPSEDIVIISGNLEDTKPGVSPLTSKSSYYTMKGITINNQIVGNDESIFISGIRVTVFFPIIYYWYWPVRLENQSQ